MAGLNTLKRMTARPATRVGRGGRRGKNSGHGNKGQNSRAGRKKRPEMRDIIKKLPKRRGYGKNRSRTVDGSAVAPVAISLTRLEAIFENGAAISPKTFKDLGVVKGRGIKFPAIKIVDVGELTKKFTLTGISVSAGAKTKIEKAGGSVAAGEPVARAKKPAKQAAKNR